MKRLAMVLTVAFTMGLAASTVSASTVRDDNKQKKECTAAEKKDCAKAKSCCSEKKAETKAEVKKK